MASPYAPAPPTSPAIYSDKDFLAKYKEIDEAIHRRDLDYLRAHVQQCTGPVNLSKDPLLSVLIAYGETELVVELVTEMEEGELLAGNYNGDTALHAAAAHGDVAAAEVLIRRNRELIRVINGQRESALHKAALFGQRGVFRKLVEWRSDVYARREDGATVLHCAVMGDAPKLALEIALEYPTLMYSRNSKAVTPLQLIVTTPQAFRSKLHLGPLESLIYKWMHIDEEITSTFNISEDIEKPPMPETPYQAYQPVGVVENGEELITSVLGSRKKYPSKCITCFDLLKLACIPVRWISWLVIDVLKQGQHYLEAEVCGSAPGMDSIVPPTLQGKCCLLCTCATLVPLCRTMLSYCIQRVKKLVPKDLEHSRNESEKTAQELFTENHKDMVKTGKDQLMDLGKTCSSLVAAVVFASSFSIPGDKNANNIPVFLHKLSFKIFSHAYVIGLSCASTALVLFLSLLTSSYQEQDFRRSLPTKYFFANMSFFLAFVALLVAFSCNIYLNIYGGLRSEMKDIIPLVCELTIFPAVCCIVLLYRGSTFGLGFLRDVWQ